MFGRLTKLIDNLNKLDNSKIFLRVIENRNVQNYIVSLNIADQIFLESEQVDGSPVESTNETKGVYDRRTFTDYGKNQNPSILRVSGLDDFGNIITESVSRNIAAGDPYVLYESGTYFNSFEVITVGDGFVIDALGERNGVDMVNEYGNILGLTNESKNKLIQEIIPLVIREVKGLLLS